MCPEIIRAVQEDDWLLPTPVQAEAVPLILGGGDVCAAAETGSGKTGAFGLPCLQIVHEALRNKAITSISEARAAGGGAAGSVSVRLSVDDKDPYVLVTEDGLEAKSDDERRWNGIRGTVEILNGKYQYEVEITTEGLVRVGWATSIAGLELGKDDKSFGYGGTGKKSWNRSFEDYGGPFGKGDVIGMLLDRDAQTVAYTKNGNHLGIAYNIPPQLHHTPLKPGVCGKKFQVRCVFDALSYPVAGYTPLAQIDPSHTTEGLAMGMDTAGKGARPPLCLILEPTRDLADQTYKCMKLFGKYLDAPAPRIGLFVGGIDEKKQREDLQKGVDICVGTLMKTMDYVRRGQLDVSGLKFLVLDEADDLMKNDDRRDIPKLKKMAQERQKTRVQTLFFSATLHSPEVRQAIESITVRPTWVDLKGRPSIPDTVHFVAYTIDPNKGLAFRPVNEAVRPTTDGVHARDPPSGPLGCSQQIKEMKPQVLVKLADTFKMESCLVFCRTNVDCDNLEKFLNSLGGGRGFAGKAESGKENPYSCVVLAGMRDQQERQRNLAHFKAGDVRFLIATDVAARGIDIRELPFLVMLTLPDDPNQFFHRVGRVGRADRMGLAISIVATEKEKVWYHKCPNRGRGCTNTKLVEEGGCTIWYDEPTYLKEIEERVGQRIAAMHPSNFSVKGVLDPLGAEQAHHKDDGRSKRHKKEHVSAPVAGQAGGMLMYGKMKDDQNTKATLKHLQELSPAVGELQQLERVIQQRYVTLAGKGI